MAIRIAHEADESAVRFFLTEKPLIGTERRVPTVEWPKRVSPQMLPAASYLLSLSEDERSGAHLEEFCAVVPHTVVASLDTSSASQLGLPSVVPYILDLQHSGTLADPGFQFRLQWRDPSQRPILRARQQGAFLSVGNQRFRIPDPHYTLLTAAEAFNAAPAHDKDGRLAFWARMRPLLPEETQSSVQVSGYLRQTRIAHASRFSLVLKKGANGISFDPILFGDSAPEHEDEVAHEVESVLPPAQQRLFAEHRFIAHSDARSRYALDAGWYVTLSEEVRSALSIVRKAQQADQETRRTFAKNPRAFLRATIGDNATDEQLDALFVETFEYSERVRGEGFWEPAVLPWIKKPSEKWLPAEEFGIQVSDRMVQVKPDDLPDTIRRVESAIARGEPTVLVGGQAVPASCATLSALSALPGLIRPEPSALPEPSTSTPAAPKQRVVLMISTHHEQVEFQRPVSPRLAQITDGSPKRVSTALKPHQTTGLAWLQAAWRCGMPGVVLADDMGLGKTLQALAFLAWRRDHIAAHVHRPILVVAPTALLKNWEQEAETHLNAPRLGTLLKAYGVDLKRIRERKGGELGVGCSVLDVRQIQAADWVLTTYETMRDYQHSFASVRFDTIILDEIQKIKTPGTLMTHAAKALNGDFVVGLSGTPVENRLADLWCVVDSTYPGYLGPLAHFSSSYESEPDAEKLRTLKASLTEPTPPAVQLMLRRMKRDHLPGLPKKHEHVLREVMPPVQARAYGEAIAKARAAEGRQGILQALHSIRSISLHPLHPDLSVGHEYPTQSARFRAALSVLDVIADKGEKALIFLESREMQSYLAGFLQRRYSLGHLPLQINGAVSGPERQSRVNRFQSGESGFDAMILSPRAGGVGLTLTAANHVIHLSRWWNPAVEDQCSDRVFRIGQTKDVHVYYPQAIHPDYRDSSFDHTLHDLLERKRQLCSDLLMPPGGSQVDADELFKKSVGETAAPPASGHSADIPAVDAMEPTDFERWVLDKLRASGYRVHKTPWSHDCGADGIATKPNCRDIVLQCKHSQRRTPVSAKAVTDLLRAREAYGSERPVLVAITNADSYASEAIELARRNDVHLIARADLACWPANIPA